MYTLRSAEYRQILPSTINLSFLCTKTTKLELQPSNQLIGTIFKALQQVIICVLPCSLC